MLTAEPSGGVVWHASRGAITLRVDVAGREAHVGQAHLGVNAFEHMIRIAEPLDRARRTSCSSAAPPTRSRATRRAGSMLVVGGASGSRRELQRRAGLGVVLGRPALQPGGGPRRGARAPDRHDRRGRRRAAGAEVAVEVLQRQPSAAPTQGIPPPWRWPACVEAVEGAAPRFELCPGVLETRWYAQLGDPRVRLRRAGGWTSRTARTSTSTRPRCAAAPRSTRCSPRAAAGSADSRTLPAPSNAGS